MYADPKHIRDHIIKVRLNECEVRLLEALAEYNQAQLAAFARDLILAQITTQQEQKGVEYGRADCAPHRGRTGGSEAGLP
jgi:hypothetical protein